MIKVANHKDDDDQNDQNIEKHTCEDERAMHVSSSSASDWLSYGHPWSP